MSQLASFPSLHFSPSLAAVAAAPLSPLSPVSLSCSSSSSSRSPPRSSPAPPPHPPHSPPTDARALAAQQRCSLSTARLPRDTARGAGGKDDSEGAKKRARRAEADEEEKCVQQPLASDDSSTAATLANIGRRWNELLLSNRTLEAENARLRDRVRQLEERVSADGAQEWSRVSVQPPSGQPPPAVEQRAQRYEDIDDGDAMQLDYDEEAANRYVQDDASQSQDSSEAVFRILLGETSAAAVVRDGRQSETTALASRMSAHRPASESEAAVSRADSHVPVHNSQSNATRAAAAQSNVSPAAMQASMSDAARLLREMDEDEQQPASTARSPLSNTDSCERKQADGEDPFATQPASQQPLVLTEDEVRLRLADARHERKQANELYTANQLQQAVEHYNRADSILAALPVTEPVHNELHLLLASRAPVYIKLPDPALALADAERLLLVKPQWWKSFALKARALAALHRMDEALSVFEAGLRCELSGDERCRLLEKKADFERKWQRFRRDNDVKVSAAHHLTTNTPATARSPPTSPIPSSDTSAASTASSTSNRTVISTSSSSSASVSTSVTARSAPAALPPSSLDAYYTHPHIREPQPGARLSTLAEQTEDEYAGQQPQSPTASSQLPATPSAQSQQAYDVLPRVTLEGLRDLLGDDGLMLAEECVEAVHAIKVRRVDDAADSGPAVVLVQAKCKRWLRGGRKRKRAAAAGAGVAGERGAEADADSDGGSSATPSMLDVRIRVEGNRVVDWGCSCYQGRADALPPSAKPQSEAKEEGMAVAVTPQPARGEEDYVDHVNHELVPCKHVGAALLLVRRKQSHAATPPTASPAALLYVHPSHALPAAVTASLPSLAARYAALTVSQLRALLQLNGDKVTGVKEELVQRCVEGQVRGVLPACDRCGGRRYYSNGRVHCRGVFDVDRKRRVPCELYWPEQAVPRRPWKE